MEWTCNECTYINQKEWKICQACGTTYSGTPVPPIVQSMQLSTSPTSSWGCPACTYINSQHRKTCDMCDSPRGVQSPPVFQQMPQPYSSSQDHQRQAPCIGWSPHVAPSNERRIVVLGRTGSGKSTTCNNILGNVVFKSDTCSQSVTVQCQRATCDRFGRNIQIIDTPGLFDTGMSNADTTREVVKCVGMTAPGPHAFVMIIRIDRFTKEEQDTVEHFKNVFGEGMMRYLLILFTRKDDLIHSGKTIQQYLQTVPAPLKNLLQSCGNRYIAFNNRGTPEERDREVQELLNQVDSIFLNNSGLCYTSEMYKEAEKAMLKREEQLRKIHEAKVNQEKMKIQQECEKKIQEMEKVQAAKVTQLMEELRLKEEDKEKQHELEKMKIELEKEKLQMEKELELERRRAENEAQKRKAACEASQPNYREEARQEVNKGEEAALDVLKCVGKMFLGGLITFGMDMLKEKLLNSNSAKLNSSKPEVKTSKAEVKSSKPPDDNPTDDDKQTERKAKTPEVSSSD